MNFLSEYKQYLLFIIIFLKFTFLKSVGRHGKLVLIDTNNKRFEISTQNCYSGVYFRQPKQFKCACVYGVWGVYTKYCDKPISIIAGEYECFKIPNNISISEFIIFGNPDYPFEPSLNHFRQDYRIITKHYTTSSTNLDIDASSPFLTITSHTWEIENQDKDTVCISGGKQRSSKKEFCYYHNEHWGTHQNSKWNTIDRISKGCHKDTPKAYPTTCVLITSNTDFPKENGIENCNNSPDLPSFGNEPPPEEVVEKPSESKESGHSHEHDSHIHLTIHSRPHSVRRSTTTTQLPEVLDLPDPIISTTTEETDENEVDPSPLLDYPITTPQTTSKRIYPDKCGGVTREDVKAYWKSLDRECHTSITDALFQDQLRRIAAKKMNVIFKERYKSLIQVHELIKLIRTLFSKTCPEGAVSMDFITEATNAFIRIIEEDFFYGIEELDDIVFKRFKKSLESCIERATEFNLSIVKKSCSNMKITGKLRNLNGKITTIKIPQNEESINYEPLIETSWKLFLNAHSYCYEDFDQSNDHHHFSTLFFSLFSASVYEKWNTQVDRDFYRFVLLSTDNLTLTLNNLDYCVGATNEISTCQTWLQRSKTQNARKRRSVWDAHFNKARQESTLWGGIGSCLHDPEEPAFKLGYGKCAFPV